MPKKLRQKFKYLENEKSLQDEMKSIFHHFWRAITEAKKFWEGESPTLWGDLDRDFGRRVELSKSQIKGGN